MEIKIELMRLKKTQKDLITELQNSGIRVTPCEMSNSLNGVLKTDKAETLINESEKIIEKWKCEQNEE